MIQKSRAVFNSSLKHASSAKGTFFYRISL
jgi:hypothetical protein